MANKIVKLININKTYFGQVDTPVLFDVNFELIEGSMNVLIGQSGSGKSTLLNIIGTLDTPTSGNVVIDGIDTSDMDKNQLSKLRNQKIGFIFQYHYLLENFTVLENILMPVRLSGKKVNSNDIKDAEKLLERMDILSIKDKNTNRISGGQRQRTAIARALMNKPSIVLADEPTGNLDSVNSKTVFELFDGINKDFGTTFLIITHDENIASKINNRFEIKDGKII